jgi:hypothetical protein
MQVAGVLYPGFFPLGFGIHFFRSGGLDRDLTFSTRLVDSARGDCHEQLKRNALLGIGLELIGFQERVRVCAQ